MRRKLFVAVLVFGAGLSLPNRPTLSTILTTQAASFQEKRRSVEKLWSKLAPLKVVTVKTKKGRVSLGEKFVDNDDEWFKGLSVVLENISGKTITYVGAGLLFPRQQGNAGKAPPLYKSLNYGLPPDAPEAVALSAQPLELKHGQKITVNLADPEFFEIKNDLIELEYAPSIEAIKFNLGEVYFADGTSWVAGRWFPRGAIKTRSANQPPPSVSSLARSQFSFLSHGVQANKSESLLCLSNLNWQQTCGFSQSPRTANQDSVA
jgi:hypothetical protein